ncbi:MAG: glycosyltransferase family 39 protein [Holosporaceae bacterium]|nr:glycosyltransferase family 39 protein [Holosporaceae bacterium]
MQKNLRKKLIDLDSLGKTRIGFFLTIVLTIFFFYEMGNRPFADPDEGRYVEIPREMVETGDFVTPRLNGLKYFEKPPLFYWMQVASMQVFGINETSMRLWPVIFAILGCLGVFWIGARSYSSVVGLISSAVLATNILYYAHSRLIILDLVLTVLMSGALWCFFIAFVAKRSAGLARPYYIVASYALSALACLTKGLIGAVLPGVIALTWVICTRNWMKIREMLHWPGILVFFAIFLPWHILMCLHHDDFLHFYFIVEHFQRYISTIHHRYQPGWFFLAILTVGLLPWTGFVLISLKNACQKAFKHDEENVFFICWIFWIFSFFSLSSSKLIPYILPILPPIALITGIALDDLAKRNFKGFKAAISINIGVIGGVILLYFAQISNLDISDVLSNKQAQLLLIIFSGFLLAMTIVHFLFFRISKIVSFIIYIFCGMNMMWIINKAAVYYQKVKKPSTRRLAEAIQLNRREGDLVFCYKRYYQDFPVYLNSTVGVVDFVGELEFGANAEKSDDRLMGEDAFWKLWKETNRRIFLLLSRENCQKLLSMRNLPWHNVLDIDDAFIVITNK